MESPGKAAGLRIGIDVGGTFTDVVAVEAGTNRIVARAKVPTTHDAPDGVAAGIVTALERILAAPGVAAERIAFLAHATTQATNALLEGDVARVGLVGVLGGWPALARAQLRFPAIELAAGVRLVPELAFAKNGDDQAYARAVDELRERGVGALVASAPFGVDDRRAERTIVERAR
ncbi:MAG: hydantoinase/oxoprolinase N-terminal domain-containing protein, partial [Vulcanimicrobiaceae bacterium]